MTIAYCPTCRCEVEIAFSPPPLHYGDIVLDHACTKCGRRFTIDGYTTPDGPLCRHCPDEPFPPNDDPVAMLLAGLRWARAHRDMRWWDHPSEMKKTPQPG